MSQPVKLYVYDLSNGMASQLSRQLTGRQIDGIWHTSVVVFGKEVFYGQGISITHPGRSHHGSPQQIVDMGETALDEGTFNEYLAEMREHYTADKYHLLDFNCNSFTNDCIGFLTGGSIPPFIKDLPADFLSTPFGASLRPTIDAMYRRPTPGATPSPVPSPAAAAATAPDPQLASALLQAVASRAASTAPAPTFATASLTAPLHPATNPAALRSLLSSHRALVAYFTSAGCPPCHVIAPVFEGLAREKAREGVAFVKVDLDVGMGGAVASEYGVRVTPTFIFFIDGKKTHELKGADARELRTQTDLLLFEVFPPHPHTTLSLRATTSLSLAPILYTSPVPLDTVFSKLSAAPGAPADAITTLRTSVLPYLKARAASASNPPAATTAMLSTFAHVTVALSSALQPAQLFPLADLWRLALLDPAARAADPLAVRVLLDKAAGGEEIPRNFALTVLRMLANALGGPPLARALLSSGERALVTSVLIGGLLRADAGVRAAAAGTVFNVAALLQAGGERDGDWEVELVSAVVEAVERESESEDVVHRLVAALALLLYRSPFYESHNAPLLEVLQARTTLLEKLNGSAKGSVKMEKKEVRALVKEVAEVLCP